MKTVAVVSSRDIEDVFSEAIYIDGKFWNSFQTVSARDIWVASQPGDPIVYRHFDVEHAYGVDTWPDTLDDALNFLEG